MGPLEKGHRITGVIDGYPVESCRGIGGPMVREVAHAERGAGLAQQWKLQSDLVDALAGHRGLSGCADPANRTIAAILAVADYVAYQAGMPAHEYMRVKISEEMWQETGLTPETSAPIVEKMIESIAEVDELVHLAD